MSKLQPKVVGLSFLSTAALAPLTANAADLYRNPPPPPAAYVAPVPYADNNIWQGFYIGLNGGYGWGNDTGSISSGGVSVDRANPQGGFGGGQAGYNFQSGSLVYGLETDFQGGDLSARSDDALSRERIDWFGTARGRVGYAFGHVLLYGTGGFAYGDVRQRANFSGDQFSGGTTQAGWVAGGGVEYKITPNWSVKSEYQYIDLGSQSLSDLTGNTANSADTSFQTVRFGVNYRFGGSAEPLK